MDRNEAVTYLKELFSECNDMLPSSVSFEQPKNGGFIGYSVHIKGSIHESDKQVARNIAKKYSLVLKDNEDGVIVYKPR